MKIYCDTSVLVALANREATWPSYSRWLADNAGWIMLSSFGWGEFVDGAARRIRRGELALERSPTWFAKAREGFAKWEWVSLTDADVIEATRSIETNPLMALKLPDAIHLAMCRRTDAVLLTGDRHQAAAAGTLSLPSHLIVS